MWWLTTLLVYRIAGLLYERNAARLYHGKISRAIVFLLSFCNRRERIPKANDVYKVNSHRAVLVLFPRRHPTVACA